MQETPRKITFLLLIFSLIFSPSTQNQEDQESYNNGKTKIKDPFLSLISNQFSSIITCRSGREKVRLRARVSMEVDTGHLPDLCRPCQRPEGCGAALRCLCHPKECKNKVVSFGTGTKSRALSGNTILFSMAMFFIM